jgi:uncharacterized protein (TIGR03437 family)
MAPILRPAQLAGAPGRIRANGRNAQVVYAGNAPTLMEGAVQVNVLLPSFIYRDFPFSDPDTVFIRVDGAYPNLTSILRRHLRAVLVQISDWDPVSRVCLVDQE